MQHVVHSTLLYGPYNDLLDEVNAIAEDSGVPIEGNLIYSHNSKTLNANSVNPTSFDKRRDHY